MSTISFGYKDQEGETFDKLKNLYEQNIKKIEDQNDLNELKIISKDLAKSLHGFQSMYHELWNILQKSNQKEFQHDYALKRGIFVTASWYINEEGFTQKEALLKALDFPPAKNPQEQDLINKWKKSFEFDNELDNKLSKKNDFEIQFIKDFKKFLDNNPQYKKLKK